MYRKLRAVITYHIAPREHEVSDRVAMLNERYFAALLMVILDMFSPVKLSGLPI
ncbi:MULTISPECIES: hypothetical protein [unclassified Methylophaga]|uniref:hypothetical protein n=1 Tax=unclassified Methylophaga TaxID=2629249 RepID=UPI0025EBF102|nr:MULTISPECIES: hypothetical protein [unclassified Methylophaga]